MKSIARPTQLLSKIFTLDEINNKRIFVGLEYKHLIDRSSYNPVVRISSPEFESVGFGCHPWEEFKEAFPKFSEFYSGERGESVVERIEGTGWTATLRRRWRLIDITASATTTKKGCWLVTLTKSDFECLVNVVKCIDDKLKYLKAIQKCVSDTVYEYYSILIKDRELNHDAQITLYSRSLIEQINENIKDTIVSDIVNKIGIKDLDKKNVPYDSNDVVIVLHEILAFHIDDIVENLNYELMYLDYLEREKSLKNK